MDELIVGSCSIVKNHSSYNEEEITISSYHKQYVLYQHTPFQTIHYSAVITPDYKQKLTYISTHKRKNLIIFEWDDIIFPTHSFRTLQHQKNKDFISKLKILVTIIENMFNEMIKLYGAKNIIIVTNTSPDWVHKCLNIDIIQDIFMKFQKLLKTHNIQIISASADRIRSKYPTNYYKWKEIIFTELFNKHFNNQDMTNCITSIGNSLCEYKASDRSSKYVNNRILNRILLKSNPSINDMICQLRQIRFLIDQFGINIIDMDINYSS
eukprot:291321_1